jgi:hypothetical protein
MRKVKFTQSNWNDKLTQILQDFPKASGGACSSCLSVVPSPRRRGSAPLLWQMLQ